LMNAEVKSPACRRVGQEQGEEDLVDLSLSQEQLAVRSVFADFFAKEATLEKVRAAEPLGYDGELWEKLAAIGATAMGLPEEVGGGGAGCLDLALVAEEAGRRIAPVPFAEITAAGRLLARAGATDLIPGVIDGTTLPTIALTSVTAGNLRLVPAGAVAELVVALDGDSLIALRREPGSRPHVAASPNLGSAPIADWRTDDCERIELARGPLASALQADAVREWKLLTAAALAGLRAAVLDLGVSYVKNRKAFGVTIGSFQAVQHRLADLAVAGDGGQLLVYEAAWAQDTGQPDAAALASMAFLFNADYAFRTARECLQFHGGYGVTLEYDVQMYFRRAKAWPLALGDPRPEYQRLAALVYPAA
jgi:alkylation response protein AidB-like acyl-CoA dehydrogenase